MDKKIVVQQKLKEKDNPKNKEFQTLIKKYKQTGDPKIKKELINSHLGLCITIAKNVYKHIGRHDIELEDLIEEGTVGLITAIDKYNPNKRTHFSTYASSWILKKIQEFLKEKKSSIEIPQHLLTLLKKWLKTWQDIYKRYGRNPTLKEMVSKLGITYHRGKKILQLLYSCTKISSLDNVIGEDEDTTIGDLVTDNEVSPEEFISTLSTQQMLTEALKCLSTKESTVIQLRYGLNEKRPQKRLSYRKIAKMLHISPQAVRLIEQRAIKKLRGFVSSKI